VSLWAGEADAIIALVRGAVPEMPALLAGAERGVRHGADLSASEKPHLFIYAPAARIAPLDWLQSEVRTTWEGDLWVDGTQEQAALYLDAIRAALAANRTLTGTVIDCALLSANILEDPNVQLLKVVAMTFETLRHEG